jgi:Uncharacterized proteins, LmbE homologs
MTSDGSTDTQTKRALVIAAHPDDPDFGAGGTAALWTQDGWEFFYLVCTNGAKGSSDPETDPDELVRARQGEQREAARALGVTDVYFLDHEDGELDPNRETAGEVVWHIRKLKPDAVFTHSTDMIIGNRWVNHMDHRADRPHCSRRHLPNSPRRAQLPRTPGGRTFDP